MRILKLLCICLLTSSIAGVSRAQCPVTAKASATTIQCGDTIKLNAVGTMTDYVIKTDFNVPASRPGNGWGTTPSASYSNPCGAGPDGTTCMWMGDAANVPRRLVTLPFNCINGAIIKFDMKYATQGGSSPCEGVDLPEEGVNLQYSINSGTTWVSIQYFPPNGGNDPVMINWKSYSYPLPPAACTANTMIRWTQEYSSGITTDHWGLDNIQIVRPSPAFVYDWLHDPATPSPNPYTPPVVPFVNTTYTVVHTDNAGITCTANVAISVVNPTASISASKTQVCANGTSVLNVVPSFVPVTPSSCGASATGCQGVTTNVNIGAGTVNSTTYQLLGRPQGTLSTCTNGSGDPDMAGRTQILYLASELPAFFKGGQFHNIALNVISSGGAYNGFTIKMICTNKTAFASKSDFVTGMATVYNAKATTITTGWNTFEFDQAFDWDGTSNIIVQICFSNAANTPGNVYKTASGFNSVIHTSSCSAQACEFYINSAKNSIMDVNRPSTRFGICYRPIPTINYTWSPSTGLSSTTAASPTATVAATTTYNVTVSDATHPMCSVLKSITISTVSPNVSISPATPTVCNSSTPSVTLTASATAQGAGNSIASYLWTPATGLSSTSSATPTATPTSTTTYTVKVTDAVGCTATQAVTVSYCPPVVLPITYMYYKAYYADGKGIVKWATAQEEQAKQFMIERSVNGIDFYLLGSVAAHGTTAQQNKYVFTDHNPSEGVNYYRLKQLDFSDETKFSNIVSINVPVVGSIQVMRTSWEGDKLNVSLNNLSESTGFTASLTDMNGRRLFGREYHVENHGEQTVSIDTETFAKGVYFLLIEDATKLIKQTKIVKL